MSQITLHIGTNKTGSTAIQHWLGKNQPDLLSRGILYPACGRDGGGHFELSELLGFSLQRPAVDVGKMLAMRDRFREEIAQSGADRVVISSEDFSLSGDVRYAQDFFHGMDVRVVLYLRRHDYWWESNYCQAIRKVVLPTFDRGYGSYLEAQRKTNPDFGNYKLLADRWAEVFGKENIRVRPYESSQNQPNLITDFLKTADLAGATAGIDTELEFINKRLSPEGLQLVDIFQRARVTPEQRAMLIRHAETFQDMRPVQYSLIPPGKRLELIEKNQEHYRYIAREFMGRDNGILFTEPEPQPGDPWIAPNWLTHSQTVEETLKAMESMRDEKKAEPKGLLSRLLQS